MEEDGEGDTYNNFLLAINSEVWSEPNTDDNDPEYIYNEDIYSHGWKYDVDFHKPDVLAFNFDEHQELKSIFNQQLRQHIQLLTQTHLLAKSASNLRFAADETKSHLYSYQKFFHNKRKPSNLNNAINLVNNFQCKEVISSIRLTWRHKPITDQVRNIIDENPDIFLYPSLTPTVAFSAIPAKLKLNPSKKPKNNFTITEDKLLAYGLKEFKDDPQAYTLVSTLLLPAKSKTQIINHVKNMKRSPGCHDNPLKVYLKQDILPAIEHKVEILNVTVDSRIATYTNSEFVAPNPVAPKPIVTKNVSQHQEPKTLYQNVVQDATNVCQLRTDSPVNQTAMSNHNQLNQRVGGDVKDEEDSVMMNETSDMFCDNAMDIDALMFACSTIDRNTSIPDSSVLNMNNSNNPLIQPLIPTIDVAYCDSNHPVNDSKKGLPSHRVEIDLISSLDPFTNEQQNYITDRFLKQAEDELNPTLFQQLIQLFGELDNHTEITRNDTKDSDNVAILVHQRILSFLHESNASKELQSMTVLFLSPKQASLSGSMPEYIHWRKVFQFIRNVTLSCGADPTLKRKISRLIDVLSKKDLQRAKSIMGTIIMKNTNLKHEFESLFLSMKPQFKSSEHDFEDISEPLSNYESPITVDMNDEYSLERFSLGVTDVEASYGGASCSCTCHAADKPGLTLNKQSGSDQATISVGKHCGNCNLKFMNRKMYLVGRVKPILAEWSYVNKPSPQQEFNSMETEARQQRHQSLASPLKETLQKSNISSSLDNKNASEISSWTYEEDMQIMEFSKLKASLDEDISFSANTFQELVDKRFSIKRSADDVAERFNQLLELYMQNSVKPAA